MTESNETNPRKTIYRKTSFPGVRSVWDWSDKKQDYVQRNFGNRYFATVEKNHRTKSESFGSIEDARKWRERMKYDLARLPDLKLMTFENLLQEFFENKKDKLQITTIESYTTQSRHFDYFLDNVRKRASPQGNIQKWTSG